MQLKQPNAEIFIPDGEPLQRALSRTTHLGVGAHQDDLEFMALHGILDGFQRQDRWFGGVTVTDGGGSARDGAYASFTDDQMKQVRHHEQSTAAVIGQYSFMAQLDYPSAMVKTPPAAAVEADLRAILAATRPEVVYTHNPADKHDTHVAVMAALLRAIRCLPADQRPARVLGCEVWRDLDWLPDSEKVVLDVSGHENLAFALNGVFDSQIAGGKRYDLAVMGRRRANAVFLESHATDAMEQAWYALDLTPLVQDDAPPVDVFIAELIEQLKDDAVNRLQRFC